MDNKENKLFSFEDFSHYDGITFWWATDLMKILGYSNMSSFQKVIERAIKALGALDIDQFDNIIYQKRSIEEKQFDDFKLTRFSCYLCVMNASSSKPEVAKAQAYFANSTRQFEQYFQQQAEIERALIREELKDGNKSLSSIAKYAGVTDYSTFTNAGYIGMYNMRASELAEKRKLDRKKLMDSMGRTELAANLFRVTQTEERIKSKQIKGQSELEKTHRQVGEEIRRIIQNNSNSDPENLEQSKLLSQIKKEMKTLNKKMDGNTKQIKKS